MTGASPSPSASGSGGARGARPAGIRVWILAVRPATLPAALSGVVVGLGAAAATGGPMRLDTAIGCVIVALLLQVVANLANDLSDFRRGADTPDRAGPLRVAAAGLVTERQLEVAISVVIVTAGLVGLWLASVGGPVLIGLGLVAVVAALAYTGGPWPYGYRGLGEVFVFVFFGLVAVAGTAYLQTGRLDMVAWWAAVPVGVLTSAILVVNNLRDIPTDRAAGKRTLAVLFGPRFAQAEYAAFLAIAFLMPVLLAAAGRAPVVLAPLLAVPLALPLLRRVRTFDEPPELNPVLRGTARLTLAYSLLFALGLALGAPAT